VTAPTTRPIVLAAGGTGGHMFPAEALAGELITRGHRVALVTDRRGGGFGDRMTAVETHRISAGGLAGGGVLRRAQGVMQLGAGLLQARRLLSRLAPAAAVGFGGYASVPTMLAASFAGIPTVLHEQNAVLGRANRLLSKRVTRIAAAFADFGTELPAERIVLTGNPVRPAIAALGSEPYPRIARGDSLRLLVVGGSQGARVFSRLVPAAIGLLPEELRRSLRIMQQCRAEDLDTARNSYQLLAADVDLASFFADMPERLRAAHLVIARAGASTVAELAAAGRPAILIPYPFATDDHQTANAKAMSAAGAAWLMPEATTEPATLAERLVTLLQRPETLAAAADAAHRLGRRDAAKRLADLVTSLIRGNGNHADAETAHREKAA
jgi:UDP-N-acetylglucosamine--N-acetylmuramyl-(pentapeptide) pyrophosphoryl-undecaprenol N-acetylglucosamine transferase